MLVDYALEQGVATLRLNHGKVNALSHAVLAELNQALDRAEQDQAVVILAGQQGIFSGGYDLKEMQKSPQAAMELVAVGSRLARRLAAFPLPVIAACEGHAIAKGAFLLLSVDYRIGAAGPFRLGLNEVAIGMTMHHAGVEMARERLLAPFFHRAVVCAEMFSPEMACQAGFLDEVQPAESVMQRADEVAKAMQQLNLKAHAQTKLKARAAYLARLDACIEQDLKHFDVI
ncbi:crotonase/enoyl-CoA hydratase family protein [Marinospirillum sp. MEB164]|uniref:Crotonase/enoyl-CoA hydratase family protein n=1 Tax=Marinospirillum alkalitolerans TaxID=3123374 RepID=A0ABW8PVF0_9GAMM